MLVALTAVVKRERNDILAALGIGELLVFGAILLSLHQITWQHAGPAAVAATLGAAVWLTCFTHRDSLGFEGRWVDLWAISHFLAGVTLALLGIAPWWIAAMAVVWELNEITSNVREYPSNRVMDVVLALTGWAAVHVAVG